MKKLVLIAAAFCMACTLSACHMEPEDVYQFLDEIAGDFGQTQITADADLIGQRTAAEDAYTGSYRADCGGNSGRDVVFGGASVEPRKLHVYGVIHTASGRATVRIRMNQEVQELSVKEDGSFETDLRLQSGGNYMIMTYEDFQGSVEMISEYEYDSSCSGKEG